MAASEPSKSLNEKERDGYLWNIQRECIELYTKIWISLRMLLRKAYIQIKLTLTKSMRVGIWVVGTINQLFTRGP